MYFVKNYLWCPAIEPWYLGWNNNIRYNICGIRISSVATVSWNLNDAIRIVGLVDDIVAPSA
jgi:hypothetical protein